MMADRKKGGSARRTGKRRRSRGGFSFWKFLGIYAGLLAVLIVIGLVWVDGLLKDYEQGMPDGAISTVVSRLSGNGLDEFIEGHISDISEYETKEHVIDKVKSNMSSGELKYVRKTGEYTTERPVYLVKAGDVSVAKISLKKNGTNKHGFTLWDVDQVSFGDFLGADNAVDIVAPSGAVVTVNGKVLTDANVSEGGRIVEKTKNVGDYTELPTTNLYKVEGLLAEPDITVVLGGTALDVEFDEKNMVYEASFPQDEELLAQNLDRIRNINIEYGKYIINKGSLSTMKSYMVGQAREYISDIPAIWAYLWGKTYTYDFPSNEVGNCVRYSDDCFSCDVNFNIHVSWGTGETSYDTSMSYVFVKSGGSWYLADFSFN
jgi:hypothetical protein